MGGIKTKLDNLHLLALENYKNKIDKSKKGRGRHRDSWLTYSIEEFLLLHQEGATNKELSEIYNVSIRYIQYIIKEIGLTSNNSRNKSNIKINKNSYKLKKVLTKFGNEYIIKLKIKGEVAHT